MRDMKKVRRYMAHLCTKVFDLEYDRWSEELFGEELVIIPYYGSPKKTKLEKLVAFVKDNLLAIISLLVSTILGILAL